MAAAVALTLVRTVVYQGKGIRVAAMRWVGQHEGNSRRRRRPDPYIVYGV